VVERGSRMGFNIKMVSTLREVLDFLLALLRVSWFCP
jgi:hypothetical protein